ncbi:MAG: TerC/Alx family metal homeostasis membrane protein [Ignavibacteriaceae bacterium]
MPEIILFQFSEYWWFYLGFMIFVLIMLAIDLGIFNKEAHEISFKESLTWTIVWVSLAFLFNYFFYRYAMWEFPQNERLLAIPGFDPEGTAKRVALEFLTGYIIEKSLSIDNIFVFVIIFNFFAVPLMYQHRVLFFGIIGALVFRIIFISMGSFLIQYKIIVLIFGIFLMLTGLKILFAPGKPIDPGKNPLIKLFKKFFPVTHEFHGQKFFVKKNNILFATPLMLALIVIELSDIIFAVDSVPAIFAITKEPLIVFTSNVFAILGLRAMYFVLAGVVHKFRYLKYGLGIVLVFVGLKMAWLNEAFGGKFPVTWSLIFIVVVIGMSILISLFIKPKEEKEDVKSDL